MDLYPQRANSPMPWIMTCNSPEKEIPSGCFPEGKTCRHVALVAGLSALCFLLLVICVALSVMYPKPEWESLISDHRNISERYITASTIYNNLTKDNQVLKERSVWLEEEIKHFNVSLVKVTADMMVEITKHIDASLVKLITAMKVEITKVQELQNETRQLKQKNVLLEEELSKMKENNQGLHRQLEIQKQNQIRMEADLNSKREVLDVEVDQTTEETMPQKCRSDWKPFQNTCYYFSSEERTWSSSRDWCQTEGADLVVINSKSEQEFIIDNGQTGNGMRLWIGMTDVEEGEWKWVDGSRVKDGDQYWECRIGMHSEPDNWTAEDPEGEDCGHINASATNPLVAWMDGSCNRLYRWICEMNIV